MTSGIYGKDFLFEYRKRASEFECFNCKLVSPKNYFILCKHCICQKCVKKLSTCLIDENEIITERKNATAFQFIITEKLLNPFMMKCIFIGCGWAGKYQNFIHNHYYECKFKFDNVLSDEYLVESNNANKINSNSESYQNYNLKSVKKNEKKKNLQIIQKIQKNKFYNNNFKSPSNFINLNEEENEVKEEENEINEEENEINEEENEKNKDENEYIKVDKKENFIELKNNKEEGKEKDEYYDILEEDDDKEEENNNNNSILTKNNVGLINHYEENNNNKFLDCEKEKSFYIGKKRKKSNEIFYDY